MRLKKLIISGYRGFESFVINEKELSNLTIIAGQNGAGKSTILEIISYLLNSHDYNQLIDFIVLMISEISQYYNQSSKILNRKIRDSLNHEGNEYCFTLKLKLTRTPASSYYPKVEFVGSNPLTKDLPQWIIALQEKQILFCQYIKPLENIGEIASTYFSSKYYDPESLKMSTTNLNLKDRNLRSNVNLNQYLKNLALSDVYSTFKTHNGQFIQLNHSLELINRVISPIILKYNEKQAKNGYLAIEVYNKKTHKSYPLGLASSGEKQVIGLTSLLLNWVQNRFKPIILMDEPDVHLHPSYVDRLGKFISSTFDPITDFTCIIATHSPELISETANHVYQISSDSKKLTKVDNFKERNNLLWALGKTPELSYLAPKIIFVEGSLNKKNNISDCDVYQKLIDNNQNNIVFIAMNGKSQAMIAKEFNDFFIKAISHGNKNLNMHTLVDGDNQKGRAKQNTYKTPYKHLENLFFLDSTAFAIAVSSFTKTQFSKNEAKKLIKEETIRQGKTLLRLDGKRAFDEIFKQLLIKFHIMKADRKELQYKIVDNIAISRLPKKVRNFIFSIKRI